MEAVEDDSFERDQPDRGERGRGRLANRETGSSDQERHHDDPTADAEERPEEARGDSDADEPKQHPPILETVVVGTLLERLAEDPAAAALLLDVDGTLAPIAPAPALATVPAETRAELARLAGEYGLVACVSGRPADDVARIVGVKGVRYVGEHGLELDPSAAEWTERLRAFAATVRWPSEPGKRLSLAFHYRGLDNEDGALEVLRSVAERALVEGFRPRWGRKVLEIRPPLDTDKGTAVRLLLDDAELERALYAGDDATDLDAFRGLDGLEVAVRVAVVSDEGPSDLGRAADLIVGGPAELVELLQRL